MSSIEPDTTEIAGAAMQAAAPPDQLAVPVVLAQQIVDYLATRPYVEVFELIQQMRALPRSEERGGA